MSTHEIISAREASEGDVFLTIRWDDAGHQTTERTSVEVAKALGWQRPDPQPVDPAWMVEVVREGFAAPVEKQAPEMAEQYRAGAFDDYQFMRAGIEALRLALSRGHVVLAPVMPSEEEMLRDAREDAAQWYARSPNPGLAAEARNGEGDGMHGVQSALQARRNVYASLGAVKAVSSGPVVPGVDLREAANKAWDAGWRQCHSSHMALRQSASSWKPENVTGYRHEDVSAILENLKSGEA